MSEELFDILDPKTLKIIGREKRHIVHKRGLLHQSANLFLFNKQNQLLIQKRSSTKDVCPNLWDLSCAEHLKVNESFEDAIIRGAKEELNIQLNKNDLIVLRNAFIEKFEYPNVNVIDNELKKVFTCHKYTGEVKVDGDEVSEVKWVDIEELKQAVEKDEGQFTPWFLSDLKYYLSKNK